MGYYKGKRKDYKCALERGPFERDPFEEALLKRPFWTLEGEIIIQISNYLARLNRSSKASSLIRGNSLRTFVHVLGSKTI